MSTHTRTIRKGEFCNVAAETPCDDCPHKSQGNYVKICEPSWGGFTYPRLVRIPGTQKRTKIKKAYEAHHILCVDAISIKILAKRGIQEIIRTTKWCVNNDLNMVAMPLWGHTVMWYCETTLPAGKYDPVIRSAPDFENIPQHDWDHPRYKKEIEKALADLAEEFKVQNQAHTLTPQVIKDEMDALAKDWKSTLKDKPGGRGFRLGGTDAGWRLADQNPKSMWYAPFSMTAGGFTKRGFPKVDTKWIRKLAKAINF